ncbi:MAG: phytanoyl-CoA dioxygenase [Rhodospirillales bacterium CG15_BIG_FIL_POST_REV_8_21_14_020_66_15]|nr:MAG: phytanoyl-CoA dioxygenase [Rhodospirillales bacterium CG15_BIG_FIL_POST_REV_8_21_14_020_66_15]
MPKILSEAQAAGYRENGFVAPVDILSPEEARHYRTRFEEYEATNGGWYELSKGQKLYLLQTWVKELCSHPKVLDAVEDVLGPNLLVWGTSLFVKDARDPGFVSWHQDATYWGLSKPDVVTAWIALSPATLESGCMKVIPGSHRWEQKEHRDTLDKHNLLTRGQELAVEVDEDEAVAMPLNPGQMSLHHVMIAHASKPNTTDDRRIGLAIRFIAPHVSQIHADRDSAWLVRGEDTCGNFIHETPPEADMDEAALAEHRRIMKLRQGVLYKGVQGKPAHTELLDQG